MVSRVQKSLCPVVIFLLCWFFVALLFFVIVMAENRSIPIMLTMEFGKINFSLFMERGGGTSEQGSEKLIPGITILIQVGFHSSPVFCSSNGGGADRTYCA